MGADTVAPQLIKVEGQSVTDRNYVESGTLKQINNNNNNNTLHLSIKNYYDRVRRLVVIGQYI